jgi:hypothetical protein
MAESFVGLENLPNVYFRDIKISSINAVKGQQRSSMIEVKLVIKDTQENGAFQWADNDLLGTYLNVTLVQSLDKNFTQQITNGQYTLNSFDFITSPDYDRSTVKRMIKRLRPEGDPQMYAVGDGMYEFEYNFSFKIKDEDLIDVAYFAALTIDQAMLGADYMADFDNSEIRFFQGPISSEKVFVDGALQTTTNVFYLPDNRIWSGPVHIHEGNYMAGAFHKPTPHPMLRLVETQNLKLKDNRGTEDISKKLNTFDGKRLFIGKPYATKDETNATKQILYFDMENMFIEKTKYGELLKSLNTSLFDQALESFKIKKLVIKRKFVSKAKGASSFKTKKDSYRILNDRTEIVAIASDNTEQGFSIVGPRIHNMETQEVTIVNQLKEVDMNDKKYRYFNFADLSFRDIKYGDYIYGIELTLIDRTKEFMSDLYKTYKNDIKDLEDYSLRSSKKKNVNKLTGKFNEAFLVGENTLFNLDNPENLNLAPWIRGVENYINLKSYLYDLPEEQKTTQAQNLYNSINPKTGTRSGITTFTEMYRNLLNELLHKFDLQKMKLGTFENRRSPANNGQTHPNLVFIEYDYEDIFDATDPIEGYRIIEKLEADEATPMIARDLFEERRVQEIDRFFRGNPNFTQDESKNLDQDDIEGLTDIASFSTAYMSPVKLIAASRNLDLTETNLVDNSLLNDTVEMIKRKPRRGRGFFRKRIRLQKLKSKVSTNDDNPRFENTSEYLGDSSPLLNLDFGYTLEDLKDIEKIKVEKKIKDSVVKKRKKKLIKDYDLTKENNVVFKEKRNKSSKSRMPRKKAGSAKLRKKQKFKKIPLHTKAIMFSRSPNVKTNLLNSPNDLLASDETENKLLIEHFGVHKIEYFAGYEMDKMERPIFNKPKWELLDLETYKNTTTKNLICRAVALDDELIGMRLPEELQLEVFDKYFIIEANETQPQATVAMQKNLMVNLGSTSSVNYDYSTTNPVSQPLKENSIFTEQPQPNRPQADVQTSTRSGTISSRQRRGGQRAVSRATSNIRGTY